MLHALPFWFDAALFAAVGFAIVQLAMIGRSIMATQADIDKLTTQVLKVRNEIQNVKTELAGVKLQLAEVGVAEEIDLSGLEAAIQAADDENPDPVVEPVVEDVVVVEDPAPPAE